MKNLLTVFLAALIFASCQKNIDNGNVQLQAQTYLNVSYGSDTAQRMDIYLPAGRSIDSTKVLIAVHGGAWISGDKSDLTPYVPSLQQRLPGWAIFNINYRLASSTNGNVFPAQENDMQAAMDFIVSKYPEYKFNKDKLVLLGESAGGHMVLLQAYKHTSPKIKAVVDFFGPTDMVDLYNSFTLPNQLLMQQLMAGSPTSNATIYQQSSPINFVSSQSPPTIILHGGMDGLVPIAESTALKTKLQNNGVKVQMFIYPTEGHGWVGPNLDDSFNKIAAFLLSTVQ